MKNTNIRKIVFSILTFTLLKTRRICAIYSHNNWYKKWGQAKILQGIFRDITESKKKYFVDHDSFNNYRKFAPIFMLLSLFSIGTQVFAEQQEAATGNPAINFGLSVNYFGKYILRGQNLDDDPVLQSNISVSYGKLTASLWSNFELTNINGNSGDFTEVDPALDYSDTLPGIEGVGYSVGVIYYDFPGTTTKDTTEIYWGLNFDLPLSPSITVFHDVDEAEGSYVLLAAGYSIEKIAELSSNMPVGMEIGISLGWGSGSYNKYYWGTDQSKLNDLGFSVSFPTEIAGWTVAPSLNYVTLVSDDIRATDAYGTDSDFFFAGVSFSKSF